MYRALGDARDLRQDQVRQERLLVDTMCDLLDASFGTAMSFGDFRPQAPTHLRRFVPGSIQDPHIVQFITNWGKTSRFADDPMMHATWGKPGPVHTTSRSREMPFEALRPHRIFRELIEPARLRDAIITFFRYPGGNATRGYVFQRTTRQKDFGPRQLRLAHLFSTELYALCRAAAIEPSAPNQPLPPRLARIAQALMTGRNQRRIARDLNLTYPTVRSYVRELYVAADVHSREELMAKLMKRG